LSNSRRLRSRQRAAFGFVVKDNRPRHHGTNDGRDQ
jgi:hypothetical protein